MSRFYNKFVIKLPVNEFKNWDIERFIDAGNTVSYTLNGDCIYYYSIVEENLKDRKWVCHLNEYDLHADTLTESVTSFPFSA